MKPETESERKSKQYNNQRSYVAVVDHGQYYTIEIRRERHLLGEGIDWKLKNRREHPCVHTHNAKGLCMLALVGQTSRGQTVPLSFPPLFSGRFLGLAIAAVPFGGGGGCPRDANTFPVELFCHVSKKDIRRLKRVH